METTLVSAQLPDPSSRSTFKIYVGIVSHGHESILIAGNSIATLAEEPDIEVVVKDNAPSERLRKYCEQSGAIYLDQEPGQGFGRNNNLIFRYLRSERRLILGDYFVLINPDVRVSAPTLIEFIETVRNAGHALATINLFRDEAKTLYDYSVRRFPKLSDIAISRMTGKAPNRYEKASISRPMEVEWSSASFLAFDADLYARLEGFDERYFMYCEDVEICRRAKRKFGISVWYYPQFTAIHTAAHRNHRLLSQHFWWFMRSYFRLRTGW